MSWQSDFSHTFGCAQPEYKVPQFKVYDIPKGESTSRFRAVREAPSAGAAAQNTLADYHEANYADGSHLVVVPLDSHGAPGSRVHLYRVEHSGPRAVLA